jgi:hypothetical protein
VSAQDPSRYSYCSPNPQPRNPSIKMELEHPCHATGLNCTRQVWDGADKRNCSFFVPGSIRQQGQHVLHAPQGKEADTKPAAKARREAAINWTKKRWPWQRSTPTWSLVQQHTAGGLHTQVTQRQANESSEQGRQMCRSTNRCAGKRGHYTTR